MIELPQLQPDVSADEDRGTVVHTSLAGGKTAQHMFTDLRRVFTVPWKWLEEDKLADLLAFRQGQYGPGPFTLITEFDTNLLEANQTSGTDARGTTYGFFATHGTLESAPGGYKGTKQLNWQLPVTPPVADPSINFRWKTSTVGVPALPNRNYAFSVYLKASSAVDVRLKMSFRTAANTLVNEVYWQPVTVGTGWTRLDVAGKSADNVAFVQSLIIVETMTGSEVVSVDQAQLEFGTSATSWKPGLGIPYVVIQDLPRGYPLKGWHSPGSVKFIEVGF
jgi:hypothetical protein